MTTGPILIGKSGVWSGRLRGSSHEGELRQLASELETLYRDLFGIAFSDETYRSFTLEPIGPNCR